MIGECHATGSKGCLVSKFSSTGQLLAFALAPASGCAQFDVTIVSVPSLTIVTTLRGHTNFVYHFDWIEEASTDDGSVRLLSASSDRTVILWTIRGRTRTYRILPHPSFVYVAKALEHSNASNLHVVTGGRDKAIRIWSITMV